MKWYSGLTVIKDPDAVLSWRWDWSEWLADGDSLSTAATTAETGITEDSTTISGSYVDVVLSGGSVDTTYAVTVRVTTAAGLTDDRTVSFQVTAQ